MTFYFEKVKNNRKKVTILPHKQIIQNKCLKGMIFESGMHSVLKAKQSFKIEGNLIPLPKK